MYITRNLIRMIWLGRRGTLLTEGGKVAPYRPFDASVTWLRANIRVAHELTSVAEYEEDVRAMSPAALEAERRKRGIECKCSSPADCVSHLLAGIVPDVEAPSTPECDGPHLDPEDPYTALLEAYNAGDYHALKKSVRVCDTTYDGPWTKDELTMWAEELLAEHYGVEDEEE
jgi:hypothetical protein